MTASSLLGPWQPKVHGLGHGETKSSTQEGRPRRPSVDFLPISAPSRCGLDRRVCTLKAFDHPVFDSIRLLGACALKEETPTGALYVFIEPLASTLEKQRIHRKVVEACPGRRVVLCVRARLPKCHARPSSAETVASGAMHKQQAPKAS